MCLSPKVCLLNNCLVWMCVFSSLLLSHVINTELTADLYRSWGIPPYLKLQCIWYVEGAVPGTWPKTVETIYFCLVASVDVEGKKFRIGLHLGLFFQIEPVVWHLVSPHMSKLKLSDMGSSTQVARRPSLVGLARLALCHARLAPGCKSLGGQLDEAASNSPSSGLRNSWPQVRIRWVWENMTI